ncbi:MAG: SseB family protein, partial [Roseovarius sp.]
MAEAETRLDAAHGAMEAAPEDEQARLAFYERLAASELFLLLEAEAGPESVEPHVFEVEGARFVLAFDLEERLAQFAGREAPYAALSGRALAGMLAPASLGLGLNLDVAPSSVLLPAEAIAWLAGTLGRGPAEVETKVQAFHAPGGLPERLLTALDARLASAAGMA